MSSAQPSLRVCRPVRFDDLVRVGKDFDGGYVMPERVIAASRSILSLGVNDDWSFEEGVLERHPTVKVVCVDGTVSFAKIIKRTVEKAGNLLGYLLLLKWSEVRRTAHYVATKAISFKRFFKRHELLRLMVSSEVKPGNISLAELFDRFTESELPCLVKCDIEGAEFEVFPGISRYASRMSALVVEFHRLDVNWQRFSDCLAELSPHFYIAHIHGNNATGLIAGTRIPLTLEVTFVNKNLVESAPPQSEARYPLEGLDMPCTPKRPDHPLVFD